MRHARQDLHAVEADADGALRAYLVAVEQRRLVLRRAPRREPAEQRHHRGGLGELAQDRVGREGERVGEEHGAGRAGELRHAVEDALAVADGLDLRVEGRHRAAVERRGPDGHRGAALDLARLGDDAACRAADEGLGLERLVQALQRRLGRRQVRAGREDHGEVARAAAERRARGAAASIAPTRGSGCVERPVPMRMPIAPAHTTRARTRCHPDADVGRHVDQPDGAPRADDAPAGAHAVFIPAVARGDDGGVERRPTSFGPRRSPRWGSRRGDGLDGAPAGDRAPAWDAPVRSRPTVVALFGPTGIGKTAVAVALAERLRTAGESPVAISADALQLYRGLGILTGAPSGAEQARLEHRLVGVLPVTALASAGEYARLAHAEIDGALDAGRRPIVVGGTGLYLRAALADLDLRQPPAPGVREHWTARLGCRGTSGAARAPRHARPGGGRGGRADGRPAHRPRPRVARLRRDAAPGAGGAALDTEMRHPTLLVALVMERAALYARIDARVDAMIAAGAEEEVRRAEAAGASAGARQALGFEELLRGDVAAMRTRTRRYAKRQLTWLRKLPGTLQLDVTGREPDDVAARSRRRWALGRHEPALARGRVEAALGRGGWRRRSARGRVEAALGAREGGGGARRAGRFRRRSAREW